MPQLIFKGVKASTIKEVSTKLVNELSLITDTPRDYFTLECIDTQFIFDGDEIELYPLIEVKWFDRGQSCKDRVAVAIDRYLKPFGYNTTEIFFTTLEKEDYYENGIHY
ncbi:MAG: DUF1904 domain-containing protein [Clostridiales bacterium]|jgi:hypothetical protein|nr:DUF1904 domain-containing protein [Clostridiales bacterium]